MHTTRTSGGSAWVRRGIAFAVLVTCLRVWLDTPALTAPAAAQVQNPASQRMQLLEETRQTNRLLAEIRDLLTSHAINVRLSGADKQSIPSARGGGGD